MEPVAPEAPPPPPARLRLRRLRTAYMLGGLAVLVAMGAFPEMVPDAVRGLSVGLAAGLAALAAWFWRGRSLAGSLDVDEQGLRVGPLRVARGDVLEAMAVPGAPPKVQLTLRGGGVVEVAVESLEAADGLIARVATATSRRALRFPGRSLWKQLAGAFGGVMVGTYIGFYLGLLLVTTGVRFGVALALPLAAIFGLMGMVSTRPIELRVGTDGLTLRGAFKTRFVPFAELAGLGENSGDPMLYYRDGHTEVIWNSAVSHRPDLLAALQHRVNGALAANAEHEGLMARAAILARQDRPLTAWRAEVVRAVDPAKGYRDAGLAARDVEAVLADARAPIEMRIAAAMAMRALDADDGLTRVRIAADGCASPELRTALERAGDGTIDEATVARAVAAVERGRGWT